MLSFRFSFILIFVLFCLLLPFAALAQDSTSTTQINALGLVLSPEILFGALVLFDNRATEFIKKTFVTGNASLSDKWAGVSVLGASFVIGVIGVILLPGIHIFGSVASSPLADYVLSGIVIAGLANGVDFFGGLLQNKANSPTLTLTTGTLMSTPPTPPINITVQSPTPSGSPAGGKEPALATSGGNLGSPPPSVPTT